MTTTFPADAKAPPFPSFPRSTEHLLLINELFDTRKSPSFEIAPPGPPLLDLNLDAEMVVIAPLAQ
jgi:hypothetical protein